MNCVSNRVCVCVLSPLLRISYCTADKMHDKVFAYIVQSQHNETLECHAFLCTKKKMVRGAQTLPADDL